MSNNQGWDTLFDLKVGGLQVSASAYLSRELCREGLATGWISIDYVASRDGESVRMNITSLTMKAEGFRRLANACLAAATRLDAMTEGHRKGNPILDEPFPGGEGVPV